MGETSPSLPEEELLLPTKFSKCKMCHWIKANLKVVFIAMNDKEYFVQEFMEDRIISFLLSGDEKNFSKILYQCHTLEDILKYFLEIECVWRIFAQEGYQYQLERYVTQFWKCWLELYQVTDEAKRYFDLLSKCLPLGQMHCRFYQIYDCFTPHFDVNLFHSNHFKDFGQ